MNMHPGSNSQVRDTQHEPQGREVGLEQVSLGGRDLRTLSAQERVIVEAVRNALQTVGGQGRALIVSDSRFDSNAPLVRAALQESGAEIEELRLNLDPQNAWRRDEKILTAVKDGATPFSLVYVPIEPPSNEDNGRNYHTYYSAIRIGEELFNRLPVGGSLILDGFPEQDDRFRWSYAGLELPTLRVHGFDLVSAPYGDGTRALTLTHPKVPVWKSEGLFIDPHPEYNPSAQFQLVLDLPGASKELSDTDKQRYVRLEEELKLFHRFGPLLPLVIDMAQHLAANAHGLGSQRPENVTKNTEIGFRYLLQNAAIQYANLMDYVELYRGLAARGDINVENVRSVLDLGCGSLYYGAILKNVFPNLARVDGVESHESKREYFEKFWQPLLGIDESVNRIHHGNAFALGEVTALSKEPYDLALMQKWEPDYRSEEKDFRKLFRDIGTRLSKEGRLVVSFLADDEESFGPLLSALKRLDAKPYENWQISNDYHSFGIKAVKCFVLTQGQLAKA